jgi:DNA-binding MarR family transcriptional regulator
MRSEKGDRSRVPETGEGKRGEEGYAGYLLRQAAGAYRLRVERRLADLEVTPPQFAVMTMLKAYPGCSNADIARLALLTPQTTSVIVSNLERAGLIRRRPHGIHGRILQIELTQRGSALLERCRKRVHAIEQELFESFSSSEEQAVRRWLVHVAAGQ